MVDHATKSSQQEEEHMKSNSMVSTSALGK